MSTSYLSSLKFAAFIMTYERPEILIATIKKLFAQSFSPAKILVIDNSVTNSTAVLVERLADPRVAYIGTGSNIGPAGASKIGLVQLVQEGYDWVYWGDDDDPPLFDSVCEDLLAAVCRDTSIGVVGAVGHYFHPNTGKASRVADADLKSEGIVEIDIIAGNMNILVNAAVVKAGILPDPALFLNIEEYDFCLRAKQAGFKVVALRKVFDAYRKRHGRYNVPIQPVSGLAKASVLWRRYYTTRNLIYILRHHHRNYRGALHVSLRGVAKAFIGFSKGWNYGLQNAVMELKGCWHGWNDQMGRRVEPTAKYAK